MSASDDFGRSESDLAQSLDPLELPPGVVMGYRSSMPIIELKLTGPAEQREAMLAIWPEVKKVAGEHDFRGHRRAARADRALFTGAPAESDAE